MYQWHVLLAAHAFDVIVPTIADPRQTDYFWQSVYVVFNFFFNLLYFLSDWYFFLKEFFVNWYMYLHLPASEFPSTWSEPSSLIALSYIDFRKIFSSFIISCLIQIRMMIISTSPVHTRRKNPADAIVAANSKVYWFSRELSHRVAVSLTIEKRECHHNLEVNFTFNQET